MYTNIYVYVPFICYFETNWKSIVYAFFGLFHSFFFLLEDYNKKTKNMNLTSANSTFLPQSGQFNCNWNVNNKTSVDGWKERFFIPIQILSIFLSHRHYGIFLYGWRIRNNWTGGFVLKYLKMLMKSKYWTTKEKKCASIWKRKKFKEKNGTNN